MKPTQAQGEHANSRQVVSWLGFEPVTLVLLGTSANHLATVLPQAVIFFRLNRFY